MSSGACASVGGDLWYPTLLGDHYTEKRQDTQQAKRICRTRCPVREECLDYALRNEEKNGIWGGLNWEERKRFLIRPVQRQINAVAEPEEDLMATPQPDPEPDAPADDLPMCVCTPAELAKEVFFKDCPRHRPAPPPWTGSDDWS